MLLKFKWGLNGCMNVGDCGIQIIMNFFTLYNFGKTSQDMLVILIYGHHVYLMAVVDRQAVASRSSTKSACQVLIFIKPK